MQVQRYHLHCPTPYPSQGSLTDCRSPEGRLPDLLANAYTAANREMYGTKTDPFGMGAFVNGTTQGARWGCAALQLPGRMGSSRLTPADACTLTRPGPWLAPPAPTLPTNQPTIQRTVRNPPSRAAKAATAPQKSGCFDGGCQCFRYHLRPWPHLCSEIPSTYHRPDPPPPGGTPPWARYRTGRTMRSACTCSHWSCTRGR